MEVGKRPFEPETILARLRQGAESCGDLGIAIDRNGLWFYRGSPIERPELVKLFANVLHRDDDGRHWLITPAEHGIVDVADAAFLIVEMQRVDAIEGRAAHIRFRTNLDEWIVLSDQCPLFVRFMPTGKPAPYVRMPRNLEARLVSSVFYELADHAMPGPDPDGPLGIWSDGRFFSLEGME